MLLLTRLNDIPVSERQSSLRCLAGWLANRSAFARDQSGRFFSLSLSFFYEQINSGTYELMREKSSQGSAIKMGASVQDIGCNVRSIDWYNLPD